MGIMLEGARSFKPQFHEGAVNEPRCGVTLLNISTHGTSVKIVYMPNDGGNLEKLRVKNTGKSGARVNNQIVPPEQPYPVKGFGLVFVNKRNSLYITQPDGTIKGPLQTKTPLEY